MGDYLTHKEIEILCDEFMNKRGWKRIRSSLLTSLRENGDEAPKPFSDRVYSKSCEVPLAFEIKPENAHHIQMKTGLGQLAFCLPYLVKPYFVISEKQWKQCKNVLKLFPWLGVLTYGNEISMKQKSERNLEGLISIEVDENRLISLERKKDLKLEDLISLLLANHLYGYFTLKELKEKLEDIPFKLSTQNLGRLLKQGGFQPRFLKGEKGYILYPKTQ